MVAGIEVLGVVVAGLFGFWWFRRTSLYRAHRRQGLHPQHLNPYRTGRYGWYPGTSKGDPRPVQSPRTRDMGSRSEKSSDAEGG
jgi:hypothetical protein